jgi:hypothetical protein
MRLTRAAQRAQQSVDEPTTDATEATESTERSPLNEISPNASPEQAAPVEEPPKKTPARTKSKKGGKKGAKGKKAKAVEEEQVEAPPEDEKQVAELSGDDAVEEPKVEVAEGKHGAYAFSFTIANRAPTDVVQIPTPEQRPASPPPTTVRLTRRQLAKQEEELQQSQRAQSPTLQVEPESATKDVPETPIEDTQEETVGHHTPEDGIIETEHDAIVETQTEAPPEIEEVTQEKVVQEDSQVAEHLGTTDADQVMEDATPGAQEDGVIDTNEQVSPELQEFPQEQKTKQEPEDIQLVEAADIEAEVIAPSVEITSEPEPKTLAAERPCDPSRTPVISRASSRRASRSPSKSPMRIEESIEALDALEEALENVGKAVSHFDKSAEEKSPRKKAISKDAATPHAKTPTKTPLASRLSKAPSAAPKSIKPKNSSLVRASSVRVAPAKDIRKGSTDTVDYLASKRRPVSVSFPTPPPPPKGRAPTKPTFQLSSDAVAAKLKAQKEERLKREAEGVIPKQRPISMPPVAKSTKAPTKATFQLPGEAVAAKLKAQKEERLKREAESSQGTQSKPRPVSMSIAPPIVKSTKPLTKATFQLPGEAVAAKLKAQREERQKREEEAEAAKKATAPKPRPLSMRKPVALPTRAQPGVSIPPPPPKSETLQLPPQRSTSLTSKRSSTQLSRSVSTSTNASNRSSGFFKAMVTPVDAVQQKLKGKEVFNRDKMEKDARDRERKEKEEAAKQARAQAAERGRIASREWAERQRNKMLAAVKAKAEAA